MAAPRLNDAQKQELVSRFQGGAGTQELAAAYGCSPNTVTRTVRAVLGDAAFERLKQQRGRSVPVVEAAPAPTPEPADGDDPADDELSVDEAADDGDVDDEDDGDEDDEEEEDDDDLEADLRADLEDGGPEVVLPLLPQPLATGERTVSRPLPLAQLPGSLYLLVDKEVELRGTRLTDLNELSPLAPEEEQHQAMVMFANPRNAKRQAGRSQRVIKVPDPSLLERTAPYIRAQGITRVVLEGVLYALPGG